MNQPFQTPARTLKVLTVQSDVRQAEALERWFLVEGHRVTTAVDGASAIRAIFSEPPDLIVMDMALPDRDGYELSRTLCYLLRERPLLVALAVGPDREGRSRAEGFDLHLEKPADLDKLADLLRSRSRPTPPTEPVRRDAERRTSRRRPPAGLVRVTCRRGTFDFGANVALGVLDVSENGARLRLRAPLDKGLEVTVNIEGQSHLRPIRRAGTIAWCREADGGAFQAGISFHNRLDFADVFNLT